MVVEGRCPGLGNMDPKLLRFRANSNLTTATLPPPKDAFKTSYEYAVLLERLPLPHLLTHFLSFHLPCGTSYKGRAGGESTCLLRRQREETVSKQTREERKKERKRLQLRIYLRILGESQTHVKRFSFLPTTIYRI